MTENLIEAVAAEIEPMLMGLGAGLAKPMAMELILKAIPVVGERLVRELEAIKPEYNGSSYFDYGARMVTEYKSQAISLIKRQCQGDDK